MPVYSTPLAVVNTQAIPYGTLEAVPAAITTFDVRRILAEIPTATVEVGPSVSHPRNWNRLHLPNGVSYFSQGSTWWTREDKQ